MTLGRRLVAFGLVLTVAGSACNKRDSGHEHATEHPEGHDHHAENHGHGDTPMLRVTRWSERLEVFVEYPATTPGKEIAMLVHVTALDDFRPADVGALHLELAGPAPLRVERPKPDQPGTYTLSFVASKAGKYTGKLTLDGKHAESIDLELRVFEDDKQARAAVPKEEEGAHIELLKEQQWGVPFATAFAARGTVIASIDVAGEVETPPGGSGEVGAPIAGRLVAPPKGLPKPGDAVKKGEVLATLAPAPSSPEEAARATLAVSEAETHLARARAAAERAERLIADQAISQRELEDARREVKLAEDALRAAQNARQLFTGASTGSGAGSWRLVSPIDGTLVDVLATPGAAVAAGTVLFRVVDTRELWIRARVPEQDASRLRTDRDASYRIPGVDAYFPIPVASSDGGAGVVTVSRVVAPASRTVDVIYALKSPDPRLRVGALVQVSVPAGGDFSGVVVPAGAILEDDGRQVAYVQLDGEHFAERAVRVGPRQGGVVGVEHGIAAGERVVTRGAHVVRLAARSGRSEPHGHVH